MRGSTLAQTRSRVAVATRLGTPEDVTEARRNHAAAKLEDYIRRTVDAAPPLTEAQRDRLAALLRPTASGGDADAA
ncbi:UNVERIFIED_CONTAM: hypothetical protein LK11_00775 [Mumia flava]